MKTEQDLTPNEALNKTAFSKSVFISDKCKLDFEKWFWDYSNKKERQNISKESFMDWFYNTDVIIQNAYLIEWFDVVGLNIYTKPRFHYGGLSFEGIIDRMEISKIENEYFKTRTEAFLKAIELANVFYNDNFV
jgi:hypothetical protein